MKELVVKRVLVPAAYCVGYSYGVVKGFFYVLMGYVRDQSGPGWD
ncbi:hypothetical protein [Vibrio owensii]|nr:hypothetical protein [Vibrio owensii]